MNSKKYFISGFLMILISTHLFCIPTLHVTTRQETRFQVGDSFVVQVDLLDNEGAYGVYFDLHYDSSIFELDYVIPGDLLPDIEDSQEFLYAVNPPGDPGRVVVSNTRIGNQPLFFHDGTIAQFVFRALQSSENQTIYLDDSATALFKENMTPSDIEIENLTCITIMDVYTHYFVQIISPYNNFKSDHKTIDFHIQGIINNPEATDEITVGLKKVVDYKSNADMCFGTEELIQPLVSGQAYFEAEDTRMFDLTPGYNYIAANLYMNGILKASAVKRVYYEENMHGVKIYKPVNNSITGKSIITVQGESSFAETIINNINVKSHKVSPEKYQFIYERQKLKEGFNKITAQTINPDAPEIVYKDTIVVYYQRDESVFDFITPLEDEVFKSGDIKVEGVIDTIDRTLVTIKMRAEFKPFGHNDDFRYVFYNTDQSMTDIVLRDLDNNENFLLSQYVFEAHFNLSLLDGYGSGILTFYAVKVDKTNTNEDLEISRRVIINSDRLEIDLQQPHLYSEEILNSDSHLARYFYPEDFIPEDNFLSISGNGVIGLSRKPETGNYEDTTLTEKHVQELVLCQNGNHYSVINSIPNRIELYEKKPDEKYYDESTRQIFYNAYAHCAVEFGNNNLLLGISNYNLGSDGDSGLVLYNNGILRTAQLPFNINHIQYIRRVNETYYLYSSNSTYLYTFDESSVVINQYDDSHFVIRNIRKYYLPNNHFINGFQITQNGESVVLATDVGLKIYHYNETADVYSLVDELYTGYTITRADTSELEGGYYVSLLSYRSELHPEILHMGTVTRTPDNTFIIKECEISHNYKAVYEIGKIRNNLFFVYGMDENDSLFFHIYEVLYGGDIIQELSLPFSSPLAEKKHLLFLDERNYILYGTGLISVTDIYTEEKGTLELLLTDDTVDGIVGFSFESPSKYEGLLSVSYLFTDDLMDTHFILFNGGGIPVPHPGFRFTGLTIEKKINI